MVFILIIYFGVFQEIKDLSMTINTVVHQMNFWRLIAFSLHDFSPKTLNFASSNENYYNARYV